MLQSDYLRNRYWFDNTIRLDMTEQNTEEKPGFLKYLLQPRPILDFFRASIYIMFGVFLFRIPNLLTDLPLYKYLFCGGALLYGGFRMYRIYAEYKRLYR